MKVKKRKFKKWVLYVGFMALFGGFMALLYGLDLVASDGINLFINNDIINYVMFTAFISLLKRVIKAILKREEEEGEE